MSSEICYNLDQNKILSSGNGFILYYIFNMAEIQIVPQTKMYSKVIQDETDCCQDGACMSLSFFQNF